MQSLVERSVIEPATTPSEEGYFMPHHGVWKRDKLRIVFNGSSVAENGLSLNACLDPGPNLLAHLLDILIRFRLRPFPALGDIEAAFHQVFLHPDDHQWVKFLWKESVLQFCRVPFGLSASPFLLHSTVIHHIQSYDSKDLAFRQRLLESMYCDNLINSFDCPDEAKRFLCASITCFAAAGMKLKILENESKVLGVPWLADRDVLTVDTSSVARPRRFTRRELLRSLSLIYDPLGIVSAWTIRVRILMQKLWKDGLSWDDEVTGRNLDCWKKWIEESEDESTVCVPRCVHLQPGTRIHVFCDASVAAYASIVFAVDPSGRSRFLFCKSRVAPIKPALSIPRLELMAALIGCRFASRLRDITAVTSVLLDRFHKCAVLDS
jgi:hypothetical protein